MSVPDASSVVRRAARLVVLVAPMIPVGGRPLLAQAGAIERIRLVPGSPVVYEPLPFDEPFYLVGPAPPELDSVGVWIARRPAAFTPCSAPPPEAFEASWERPRGTNADSFYIRIDPLAPNHTFDMCVRTRARPLEERFEELQARWAATIDSAFARNSSPSGEPARGWEPTATELVRFRTILLAQLGPPGGVGTLLPAEEIGTGLASPDGAPPGPGGIGARALPARLVARLSEAQYERDLAWEGVEHASEGLDATLAFLGRHPSTRRLVATRILRDPPGRAIASLHRDGLETLAHLHARVLDTPAFVAGPASLAPAGGPRAASRDRFAAIDTVLARLGRMDAGLRAVLDLLGTLRAAPNALEAAGLTAPAVLELDSLVRRARTAISSMQDHAAAVRGMETRRQDAIEEVVQALVAYERASVSVETHTHYDVETAARNHVAADFGALYLWQIGEVTPVLGANVYFRPVNRDRSPGGDLLRRLSLSVGVTTSSLRRDGHRDDLFGSMNLTLGLGVRFGRLLRVSAGGVLFRRSDGARADDAFRLAVTPHVAVSLDFVVKDLISNLFGAVF